MAATIMTGHPTPVDLRLLAEYSSDVTFTGSNDGVVTWVSAGVEELLGWTASELIGRPFTDLLTPDEIPGVVAMQRGVLEGSVGRSRLRLIARDGTPHWVDVLVKPMTDEEGRVVGRFGSWRQVDREVTAEEELRLALAQRDALFATMLDPLVLFEAVRNEDGVIVDFVFADANVAACDYNGMTHDELVGSRLLELLPAHATTELMADYVRVVETGEPLTLNAYAYPQEILGGQIRFYDVQAVKLGDGLSYTWRDVTERLRIEKERELAQRRLRMAMDVDPDPSVIVTAMRDDSGAIVDYSIDFANPSAAEYFLSTVNDLQGRPFMALVHGSERDRIMGMFRQCIESDLPIVEDGARIRAAGSGQSRMFDIRGVKVNDGLTITWRDVTDRVQAQQALEESEQRYRLLAENVTDVIVHIRDGRIVWVSPSVESATGRPRDEFVGTSAIDMIVPEDRGRYASTVAEVEKGPSCVVRVRVNYGDGPAHWVDAHVKAYVDADGRRDGTICSARIVDDLVVAQMELEHVARYDSLTGLMNRGEALAQVESLRHQHRRRGTGTAVLFCDVDHFKEVNDLHGHAAGDEVLRVLGARLRTCLRSDDYAARIGGDELLLVLTGIHDAWEAREVAEKVRFVAAEPIPLTGGGEALISLSIGLTAARDDETTDELVRRADAAMYRAKAAGRDQVVVIT